MLIFLLSGEHKERRLLQFLRDYMLLAEIAYIEQIAPVSQNLKLGPIKNVHR